MRASHQHTLVDLQHHAELLRLAPLECQTPSRVHKRRACRRALESGGPACHYPLRHLDHHPQPVDHRVWILPHEVTPFPHIMLLNPPDDQLRPQAGPDYHLSLRLHPTGWTRINSSSLHSDHQAVRARGYNWTRAWVQVTLQPKGRGWFGPRLFAIEAPRGFAREGAKAGQERAG